VNKKQLIRLMALIALLSALTPHPSTFAQGTAFTYQGRLSDQGNPANGSYDLTFAVFDALTAGTQVSGTVTNGATSVSNGQFTVSLDFGPGVFMGDARWLEVGVQTSGGGGFATLSPRQQLTPVPYAIYSGNSAHADIAAQANQASGVVSGAISAPQLSTPGTPGTGQVLGYNGIRQWVSIGAIVGMLSSLLVFQYGQARIWFAMSRDGLLPKIFSKVHPVHKTPHISTWIAGLVVGIPAGIWDIGTFADLANIGTLFAFIIVSLGVIVLRKTQPDRKRGFKVPGSPWLPMVSIAFCLVLMMALPLETWVRFFVWLIVGFAIYFPFGRKNSALARG